MPATALATSRKAARGRATQVKKAPASAATHQKPTSNVVNLRVDRETYSLIERARESRGQNRTDFMLESARIHAKEILLSQTRFTLSDADWASFQAALEAPPMPTQELIALMARKAPWEE